MSAPLFVYGTLLDPAIRGRVLGRPSRPADSVPALLYGCERVFARGHHYPVLVRRPDGAVDGLLIPRLTARERRRLRAYEGSGYRLVRVRVRALSDGEPRVWAKVFAAHGLGATARPWVPIAVRARRAL